MGELVAALGVANTFSELTDINQVYALKAFLCLVNRQGDLDAVEMVNEKIAQMGGAKGIGLEISIRKRSTEDFLGDPLPPEIKDNPLFDVCSNESMINQFLKDRFYGREGLPLPKHPSFSEYQSRVASCLSADLPPEQALYLGIDPLVEIDSDQEESAAVLIADDSPSPRTCAPHTPFANGKSSASAGAVTPTSTKSKKGMSIISIILLLHSQIIIIISAANRQAI